MQRIRHIVIHADSGHTLAWTWDSNSRRSTRQTLDSICRASQTPGMGLSLAESLEAQTRVRSASQPKQGGIYGFFMQFFGAAVNDRAVVELTQEIAR